MVTAWVPAAGLCSFAQEQAGPIAGGIQLQADLGPGGCYKSGRWTYVTGVASNIGAPFEGYVRVLLRDARVVYAAPIHLPTNSRKRFWLYLKPPSYLETVEVSLAEKPGSHSAAVVVCNVKNPAPGAARRHVVVVGPKVLSLVQWLRTAARNCNVAVTTCPEHLLPDRWQGYEGVDLLIMAEPAVGSVSQEQIEAIQDWVMAGGRLVVAVSAGWQLLAQSKIAEVLPAELTGLSTSTMQELERLGYTDTTRMDEKMLVANFTPREGTLMIHGSLSPLVARGRFGLGIVGLFAFDISAQENVGWKRLAQTVADSAGLPDFFTKVSKDNEPVNDVRAEEGELVYDGMRKVGIGSPLSWSRISVFVALYFIIVLACQLVIPRFYGKSSLAGRLWFPACVLAFSVFSICIYFVGRQTKLATYRVSVLTLPSDDCDGARVVSFIGLLSPDNREVAVEIPASKVLISPLFRLGKDAMPFHSEEAAGITVLQYHDRCVAVCTLATWVVECLELLSLDGTASVAAIRKGLSLKGTATGIAGSTGFSIEDSFIVEGARFLEGGDFAQGSFDLKLKWRWSALTGPGAPDWRDVVARLAPARTKRDLDKGVTHVRRGILSAAFAPVAIQAKWQQTWYDLWEGELNFESGIRREKAFFGYWTRAYGWDASVENVELDEAGDTLVLRELER